MRTGYNLDHGLIRTMLQLLILYSICFTIDNNEDFSDVHGLSCTHSYTPMHPSPTERKYYLRSSICYKAPYFLSTQDETKALAFQMASFK